MNDAAGPASRVREDGGQASVVGLSLPTYPDVDIIDPTTR